MMAAGRMSRETTLTSKNQVSLPVQDVRALHWEKGDVLLVNAVEPDMIVLMRKPESWTKTGAGRLSHVFGAHEETMAWLEREHATWDNSGGR